jgi:septal ring factor EnvC (AmiA/AmiB activator)
MTPPTPQLELTIDNIAGIDHQRQTFRPGTTLVTGHNASNRSSLLEGLMTVLGSTSATLRTGSEQGQAHLSLGETEATATLTCTDGTTVFDGDPYLTDPHQIRSVEFFAWLSRENPIQQAVRQDGDGLRELLLQPIDTDEIDRRLQTLRSEIDALEADYEAATEEAAELSTLKRERDSLTDKRADCQIALDELTAKIDEHSATDTATHNHEEIASCQATLEEVQEEIGAAKGDRAREQNRLERLTEDHAALEDELATLNLPDLDKESLAAQRAEVLTDLEGVRTDIERLEELIAFNRDQLAAATAADGDPAGDRESMAAASSDATQADAPTSVNTADTAPASDHHSIQRASDHADHAPGDRSDGDGTAEITCWTCGQRVHNDRIQETIQQLRQDKRELAARRDTLEDTCKELDRKLATCNEHREKRDRLQTRREELETKIDQTERTLSDLDTRIAERTDRVAELQERLDSLSETDHHEQLCALQDERADKRAELARVKAELEAVEDDIEAATAASDRCEELERELEAKRDERDTLRTRRREREQAVIETFNESIEGVLDDLAFEDIERIWLERTDAETGGQSDPEATFVLHLARTDDEGVVHRDRLATLSDSEREVVGLVLALAGFRAHDIREIVPLVVLDGIELLDPPRLAALLDSVAEHAEYVITTALADDARTNPLRAKADTIVELDGEAPAPSQPVTATETDSEPEAESEAAATDPTGPPTHDQD